MDDLFNVLILAIIFLLSTAFGGKKKKRPGPTGPSQPAKRQGVQSTSGPRAPREVHPQPRYGEAVPEPRSEVQDIFELLRRQAEARAVEDELIEIVEAPEADPWALYEDETVVSLETLEGMGGSREDLEPRKPHVETYEVAGGASHDRFHSKYIVPLEEPPTEVRPHFEIPKGRMSLRKAVIWQEILGEPKGLR